jgi:hypothetical protein
MPAVVIVNDDIRRSLTGRGVSHMPAWTDAPDAARNAQRYTGQLVHAPAAGDRLQLTGEQVAAAVALSKQRGYRDHDTLDLHGAQNVTVRASCWWTARTADGRTFKASDRTTVIMLDCAGQH